MEVGKKKVKRIKKRAYNGKPNNPFEIKFLSEFLSSASTNTVRASHVQSITVSLIQLAAFCFLFIPSPPFCHIKVLLKCESTPKSFSQTLRLSSPQKGDMGSFVTQPNLLTECENSVPRCLPRSLMLDAWKCDEISDFSLR